MPITLLWSLSLGAISVGAYWSRVLVQEEIIAALIVDCPGDEIMDLQVQADVSLICLATGTGYGTTTNMMTMAAFNSIPHGRIPSSAPLRRAQSNVADVLRELMEPAADPSRGKNRVPRRAADGGGDVQAELLRRTESRLLPLPHGKRVSHGVPDLYSDGAPLHVG